MKVFEHIRQSILRHTGVEKPEIGTVPDLPSLKLTEWSSRFEKYMRNRLIMGRFRYGALSRTTKTNYDNVQQIIFKAKTYQVNGNDELLVDIANLALVEFEIGTHANKHFYATDDLNHVPYLGD